MRSISPSLAPVAATLLAVLLTGGLILGTVVLFGLSYLAVGPERSSTFVNTFFIQCVVFTFLIGLCLQSRGLVAGLLDLPRRTGAQLVGLRPAGLPVIALSAVAGAGLTFPLGELDNLWQYVWPATEEEMLTMLAIYEPGSAVERVFIILALVGAAPLGEELIFRGIIWTWVRDSSRPLTALVVTAVLFGGAHVFIPRTIILIVPVGLCLGYLVMRTGSVLASMAAHAAFNGAPLVSAWSGLTVTGWNNVGAQDPHLHPVMIAGGTAVLLASLAGVWLVTRGSGK